MSKPGLAISNHAKGILYGLLSAVFLSGYVLVNRYVYTHYDVAPFNYAVTFAVMGGVVALVALVWRHLQKHNVQWSRTLDWRIGVVGLAGGVAMGLIVLGQSYTTAVNAAIVMTSSTLSTVLFSWLMLKESLPAPQRWWLGVMFVGLYLGVVGLHIVDFRAGDLIIFGAMVILGFNNVFSKLAMRIVDAQTVADARLVIGGLLMLAVGLALVGPDVLVTNAGWWPFLAGLFLWLCIRAFYAAIQLINPNQTIVLNNTQIFFTALVGVWLLAEPYDWVKFAGSAIVLASVYFITKK